MLSCKEVSRLVSESLDRKLPLWQRIQVRLHLMMCGLCSQFHGQMLFLRDAAHQYLAAAQDAQDADAGLSSEARARIKQTLKPNPS